jgi:hypothetical protein
MKMKTPPDSNRVVSPVSLLRTSIASIESSPCAAVASVRVSTSMFDRAASWSER